MSLFLIQNYADMAQVTASSEWPTAPVKNLQDPARFKVWRSDNDGPSVIDIILYKPMPIDYVAFVDTNMTKTGQFKIQAWNGSPPSDESGAVVDIVVEPSLFTDPFNAAIAYSQGFYSVGTYGGPLDIYQLNKRNVTIAKLDEQVTCQYWRITCVDNSVPYHELSRIFLGPATSYDRCLAIGYNLSRQENSVYRYSLGRNRYGMKRPSQLVVDARIPMINRNESAQYLINMMRLGDFRPFIFSLFPENTDIGRTHTLYGHYEDNQIRNIAYNANDVTFQIVEDV